MPTNHQSGFSVIVVALVVLVVAVAGYIGWRVWDANSSHTATSSTQTSDNAQNTTTQDTYLDIKELGVKIKLSDSIKDAVYYYSPERNAQSDPKQVSISTTSLSNAASTCNANGADGGLGAIIKTANQDLNGVSLVPNDSTIFKLGDDYYYLVLSGSPCSENAAVNDMLSSQRSALAQAFKTIQLDN